MHTLIVSCYAIPQDTYLHASNCIDSSVTFISISYLTALLETRSKHSHNNMPTRTCLNLMWNYANLVDTTKVLLNWYYYSDWIHIVHGVCLSHYPSLLNCIYFKITTRIYSGKAITALNPLIQKFTYFTKKVQHHRYTCGFLFYKRLAFSNCMWTEEE